MTAETKTKTPATPPTGKTIDEVLKWVDGDPARAQEALAAESEKDGGGRPTLTDALQAIIAPAAVDPAPQAETAEVADAPSEQGSVLVEQEILSLSLPRRGARIIKTVAVSPGTRVARSVLDRIERNNEQVREEAEKRSKVMDSPRTPPESEGTDQG